jgi:peroxisomal coenzyme A diphosphatase NUDT7
MNVELLKNKLPKTPNIIGRKFYINTAVIIPLVKINEKYHLLFQERSAHIRQGTEICFPGGKVDFEKDKSLEDTAVRETIEELGITKEKIEILGCFHTLTSHMGVIVNTFAAELYIDSIDELKIDANEVKRVFTLPISYFKNNQPKRYDIRIEAQPTYIDENGKKIISLPCKELGLPDRYLKPWGNNNHRVLVYQTGKGVIWGITAKILFEFLDLF